MAMKCLPYKSEKLKRIEGGYIWFNQKRQEHSFNDQPACLISINKNDILGWKVNGMFHRDYEKPAVINLGTGWEEWYFHNEFLKSKKIKL